MTAVAESAYPSSGRLPRRLAEGLYWLGGCSHVGKWSSATPDGWRHEPVSAYLLVGDDATMLVDTGHFSQWKAVERQLDVALGGRTLDYVFPTHQEVPHAGNLERLLLRYPASVVVGNVDDYHLHVPWLAPDRLRPTEPGETLELGDERFTFLPPIWFDLRTTLWGWAERSAALLSADAMDFAHRHAADQCGLTSEELTVGEVTLHDKPGVGAWFWMPQQRMAPRVAAFRALMHELAPRFVCSSHGAPIAGNVEEMVDAILEAVTRVGAPEP